MKTARIPRRGAFQPLNKCVDGESIEVKIRRIVDEKEPITDGAPIIFTDAKDGVRPEFNPRTDRWEIAIDAMDKVSNYQLSKYTQSLETPKKEEKQAYRDWETDRKSTRLNSSHRSLSRMPSSA